MLSKVTGGKRRAGAREYSIIASMDEATNTGADISTSENQNTIVAASRMCLSNISKPDL